MRIAMLAPPWIPVPPRGYGGIEWVVHLLVEELVRRGHQVTLFATGDSRTSAELVFAFEEAQTEAMHSTMHDALHAGVAFRRIVEDAARGRGFDVLHDHTAWIAVAAARLLPVPVVHTFHGSWDAPSRTFFARFPDAATYVTLSDYQRRDFPEIPYAAVVPNAVDVAGLPFRADKEDYLLCLGRVSRQKGQGIAVRVAQRLGIPLVLAGKVDPGDDTAYFEEAVLPHVDGRLVRFEGEVPHERKLELLAGARAMLFPITWPEPFGLVMAEAAACGTPVVAFRQGSVPEVVVDGETGFIVEDEDEMVKAVERVGEIAPARCRAHAERAFSPAVMAERYLRVYEAAAR
jgi:glycosyltransferase involved in cell wall biosynthesis